MLKLTDEDVELFLTSETGRGASASLKRLIDFLEDTNRLDRNHAETLRLTLEKVK